MFSLFTGLTPELLLYKSGQLFALTGFVLIFIKYILSSRIRWVERGTGLDRLFRIHRTCGIVGFVLVFLHPVQLFIAGRIMDIPLQLDNFKLVGILGMLIIIIAAGAAIFYTILRLSYETWRNLHRLAYAALPFAFFHSFFIGSTVHTQPVRTFWLILGVLYIAVVVYRLHRWIMIRKNPYTITKVEQETHDTWSLHFKGKKIDYIPGQFMILRLIRDGIISEPHPFTISSSPTGSELSITAKSVGDFTSTIKDTKLNDKALIDAPFGAFSFLNYDAQRLLFIAGGIGITPFVSMLRYIKDMRLKKDIILIWGNKTENDIIFKNELESLQGCFSSMKVVHVLSMQETWQGEKGYIDSGILVKHINNFEDGEFFICGPPAMTDNVIKVLRARGVHRRRIHYERFSLR